MIDFIRNLFFYGIQVRSAFFDAFLVNTIAMFAMALVVVYLVLLVLLMMPLYRSERVRVFADEDSRVKLCGIWATYLMMLVLILTIIWMYWNAVLPATLGIWGSLWPLSAHATVLALLFFLWLALYRSVRGDSLAAQRTLP